MCCGQKKMERTRYWESVTYMAHGREAMKRVKDEGLLEGDFTVS